MLHGFNESLSDMSGCLVLVWVPWGYLWRQILGSVGHFRAQADLGSLLCTSRLAVGFIVVLTDLGTP